MAELTFKQAIIVASIPSLLSLTSSYYSHSVENNQAIIQARLTERDLISQEATDIYNSTKEPTSSYQIPVADNRAWINYFACRKDGTSRYVCAEKQKEIAPKLTPEIIIKPVNFGYES